MYPTYAMRMYTTRVPTKKMPTKRMHTARMHTLSGSACAEGLNTLHAMMCKMHTTSAANKLSVSWNIMK